MIPSTQPLNLSCDVLSCDVSRQEIRAKETFETSKVSSPEQPSAATDLPPIRVVYTEYRDIGQFIWGGVTGAVELLDDGRVLKRAQPCSEKAVETAAAREIAWEARLLDEMGPHPRIVKRLEFDTETGYLYLEYMQNGSVKDYMKKCVEDNVEIPLDTRLKWIQQEAEGLQFLHDEEIIYCDLKPRNSLLDLNLDLKLCDFAGSSYEGRPPRAAEATRYRSPREWMVPSSRETDLFALGSFIFEVVSGRVPYADTPSDEVVELYRAKEFPNTEGILCGDIARRCWLGEVQSAKQVVDDVKRLRAVMS